MYTRKGSVDRYIGACGGSPTAAVRSRRCDRAKRACCRRRAAVPRRRDTDGWSRQNDDIIHEMARMIEMAKLVGDTASEITYWVTRSPHFKTIPLLYVQGDTGLYANSSACNAFQAKRHLIVHPESMAIVSASVSCTVSCPVVLVPSFNTIHLAPSAEWRGREDVRTFTLARVHSLSRTHSWSFIRRSQRLVKTGNKFVTTTLSTTCSSNDLSGTQVPQLAFRQGCVMGGMA